MQDYEEPVYLISVVAKVLNIHETTFGKWFREPVSKERQMQILSAVESIKLSRVKEEK